ncbi:hypothetical protein F4774DRAFT_415922 [Daldinia eschscholtzii]|nr:hypothetical protein F4774DRAFT_415922 [Daldinia eschscholtzii]
MKDKIINTISAAVDGMFLLAQLYIGFFGDKTTMKEVKAALKSFKKKSGKSIEGMKVQILNDAYETAMERVNG